MHKKVLDSQVRDDFANKKWHEEQEAGMFMMQGVVKEHFINNATQAQGLFCVFVYQNPR
jgi:hypothetical protein